MIPALRLESVRYAYQGSRGWALDGIDLELAPGRVLGIVGPNEAGKSTLCLVASGLAPRIVAGRLEGSVRLGDRETRDLAPHAAAVRCGLVFQDPSTQLSGTTATVYEEVALGPRNLGLPLHQVGARVEEALSSLGLDNLAPRHPAHLSGGQAQLVAIASVLALRPAMLVLDEPTSQLDPDGTALVVAALARLAADRGTAILIAEHRTALLQSIADDVALIDGGRIVALGSTASVLGDPVLAAHGVTAPPTTAFRHPAVAG